MSQTVFLTGGSGFVGSAVLDALLDRGHDVKALVNRTSIERDGVESVTGGLFDADLAGAMAGCDAVIHLVGIIAERGDVTFERMHVEATRRVVDAAKAAGVGRYVHMSALGTRPDAVSDYHTTKWRGEEIVRADAPAWTIFRPSMIHGRDGEFTHQMVGWACGRALPFVAMPYFGTGPLGLGEKRKVQPVWVRDVARVFIDTLKDDTPSRGRIYNVAGPEAMTWPQMYRHVAEHVRGKPRATLPIPAWYAKLLTYVTPASLLPFNRAQVQMALEDNAGDTSELCSDFGFRPATLADALDEYGDSLRCGN